MECIAMGIALTTNDVARIISAVGTVAVSILRSAKDEEDMKEAIALHRLHGKLIAAFEDATKTKQHVDGDAQDADGGDESN